MRFLSANVSSASPSARPSISRILERASDGSEPGEMTYMSWCQKWVKSGIDVIFGGVPFPKAIDWRQPLEPVADGCSGQKRNSASCPT